MTEPGRGPSSRPQQHNRNPSLPHRTKVLTQNPIRNGARPHSSAQEQHLKHKRIASNTARPATQNRANSAPLRPYQRDDSAKAVYDTDPVPSANTGTFLFRASVSEDRAPFDTATTSIDLARSRALDRLEEQNYQLPSSDLMPFPHDILLDVPATNRATLPRLDVAVVGAKTVGKSTFIRLASSREHDHVSPDSVTFAVDNHLCNVIFHEVDIDKIELDDEDSIRWDHPACNIPRPDGIILLYSVMDPPSLKGVPDLLRVLEEASDTVVLTATHCDHPPESRMVDPDAIANKAREVMNDVAVYKSALYAETRPKAITHALLSRVIARQSLTPSHDVLRQSDFTHNGRSTTARPRSPQHSVSPETRLEQSSTDPWPSITSVGVGEVEVGDPQDAETPRRNVCTPSLAGQKTLAPPTGLKIRTMLSDLKTLRSRSPRSFLDLDDSPQDVEEEGFGHSDHSEESPLSPNASATSPDSDPRMQGEGGTTFQELVDKLLKPVPDEKDVKFEQAFLAFYRLFAPPSALLEAIISHFEFVVRDHVTPWEHETALDRDLTVLETWIGQYPGDFAKSNTRRKLQAFLARLVKDQGWVDTEQHPTTGTNDHPGTPILGDWSGATAAAQQMSLALEGVIEDDDTDWACADQGTSKRSRANTFLSISSVESYEDGQAATQPMVVKSALSHLEHDTKLIFGGQSTVTLAAIGRSRVRSNNSTDSSTTLVNVAESAQRQASLLTQDPVYAFDKPLWRSFMSQTDEHLACELTRIDWILFSAIRPRDLIRNVSISSSISSTARTYPASENVTRMIDHFNHVAYWVTNLILLRDKPKHRAAILEKLMRVARELRKLNNYNSLGAFIAAIRGPAISRLGATRELVDADVQKKFASLELLMSTARGHWAYRFALENSEQETIPRLPFLPLHRRDLTVAESAGKTFISESSSSRAPATPVSPTIEFPAPSSNASSTTLVSAATRKAHTSTSSNMSHPQTPAMPLAGPKINWSKFAVMGETLAVLQRAQGKPYPGFAANEEIKILLLKCKICKDDDELYERSVALEGGAAAYGERDFAGQRVRRRIQGGLEKLQRMKS